MKTKWQKWERDRVRTLDAVVVLPVAEVVAQAEAYIPRAFRPHFHRALMRRARKYDLAAVTSRVGREGVH